MTQKLPYDPNHVPSERFKNSLRRDVLKTFNQEQNMQNKYSLSKIFKFAVPAVACLVVVGGVAFKIIDSKPATTDVSVAGSPNYNSSSAGSAAGTSMAGGQVQPAKKYSSISEVLGLIEFKPLVINKSVDSEKLTEIYMTEGLTGGNEKSLRYSFGTQTEKYYEVIQTKALSNQDPLPAEVAKVELLISGKKVIAARNEFWNDKTPKQDIYPGTPRQSIGFTVEGVSIELTEYGTISLEQLKSIAESVTLYK